jgi:hypothetical protein
LDDDEKLGKIENGTLALEIWHFFQTIYFRWGTDGGQKTQKPKQGLQPKP